MKIVHIASEAVPLAKTGGLADVVAGLAAAQAERGHRVFVVLPLYRRDMATPPDSEPLTPLLDVDGFRFKVWSRVVGRVTYILLDAPRLFARPAPYGTADGDYPDNPIRFAAFARAAVLAVRHASGGADILHCHDWQAALVPQLLQNDPLLDGVLEDVPSVLSIHNLAYQGSFPPWVLGAASLPSELYTPSGFEFHGQVNYLKGGILAAKGLTTVSPSYAREILTPAFGCGLDPVLRARREDLVGILNGLDTALWNPAEDPHLDRRFTPEDVGEGKRACRTALAREVGLVVDGSPLAAMVSRLVEQKGVDLVADAADAVAAKGTRLVVLGSGDPYLEQRLAEAAARNPGRIALRTGFNDPLAHRIYAGADLLLMPSRFEPCGLGQLIALRYGTLPVVNPTGGLADTVHDLDQDPENGNGFYLSMPTSASLVDALRRAAELLANPLPLLTVRRRAMAEDHGWKNPARQYEAVYEATLGPMIA